MIESKNNLNGLTKIYKNLKYKHSRAIWDQLDFVQKKN